MTIGALTRPRLVLDPIERVSEIVFGVLMALSFTGSLSVATAGQEEIRTMLFTALGCNLAWGLTDAVMYLVGTATERRRKVGLLQRLHEARDKVEAHRLIADALPERLAAAAGQDTLESMRKGLVAVPVGSAGLGADDYVSALGVFALVVLATFPVVVPFIFIRDAALAVRVSNLLALVTLFIGGYLLGRYAGGRAWRSGFIMIAVGVALIAIIMALGG
jgi:VIT1/CCC1 family predicted Fe2+/Mn2+ transporter